MEVAQDAGHIDVYEALEKFVEQAGLQEHLSYTRVKCVP